MKRSAIVGQRLIPRHALPLVRRRASPTRFIGYRMRCLPYMYFAWRKALLAAARTVVRSVRVGLAVCTLLFLAPDDTVLDVDIECAAPLAVRAVSAVRNLDPRSTSRA